MTSPISLLAMLGGTTVDPAATTEADDPALFAAALVSALQQLQPPVKLLAPVTPVVVEGEIDDGEVDQGEVPAEANGVSETLGQMLDSTKVAASDPPDRTAQLKTAAASHTETETPKPTVDVVPQEPARPTTASTLPTELAPPANEPVVRVDPAKAIAAAVELSTSPTAKPLTEVKPSSRTAKTPEAPPADEDPPSAAPVRVKTRTASKGELLVGDWSPPPAGFTGWKAPVQPVKTEAPKREGAKGEAQDQVGATDLQLPRPAPVQTQVPIQVILPQMPVSAAPIVSQPVTAEEQGKPAPVLSAPPADQTVDLDSSNDSVRQVQVANARVAARLAELVGDRDVTDFRVQLGKGKREPDATGTPVVKLPVEAPTLPAAQPVAKAPLMTKGEQPDQAVAVTPRPTSTETPIPVARQTVTSNRLMDLTDGPPIAGPLQAARAAAGPIVPALRKEMPAASQSEKKPDALQPEKARLRDDSPSEPPAAASSASQSQDQSLTNRSEPDATRGNREARNLPQESSGNDRPAGSADRVTVQVSDSEGRQTRIRVSVLGDQVRAVIVPPDSESARQLEQRMDDLQTALARQGFASSKVSVQQAGENAVERNGAALAGMAGGGEGKAAASPGRDQPAGDQRQGRGQREQQHPGDGHRHPNGRSRDQGAEHRRRFTDL